MYLWEPVHDMEGVNRALREIAETFSDWGAVFDWLPTYEGTVDAGSPTYTDRGGQWQKVGPIIIFQGYVGWSNITGHTGNPRVGGLPYPSRDGTPEYRTPVMISGDDYDISANQYMVGTIYDGESGIRVRESVVDTGEQTNAPFDTAGVLFVAGHYWPEAEAGK